MASIDTPNDVVLTWIVSAGTALSTLTPSGYWRADIYPPKTFPEQI
jgi:hypothetical protein